MNTNAKAKRILCYGDSNTWGRIPSREGLQRFSIKERWPGILQDLLGQDYEVIEEGLGGRNTMFEDPRPKMPERNGLRTLPIILETHAPLDSVILMLGTTDTKEMLNLSSQDTTEGMRRLIKTVKGFSVLEGATAPQILIVVPAIVKDDAPGALELFKGASAKGKTLVESYAKLAEEEGVLYLDINQAVKVDEQEGIHLDADNHRKLAKLIYDKINTHPTAAH